MATSPAPPDTNNWQRALYLPLTILAWLALGIVTLWLLGHVARALIIVVLAIIIAYALAPLITLIRRWVSRPLAVIVAYLLGITIVFSFGLALIITAASQVVALVGNLPAYTQHIGDVTAQLLVWLGPFGVSATDLRSFYDQVLSDLQGVTGTLATGSLAVLKGIASSLADAILVLILSVYLTLDAPRAIRRLRQETPPSLRHSVDFLLDVADQVASGYVRGTLTMALLIGTLVGGGLALLSVPYAVLLGVLAFFMQFVPMIGVFISGAVSLVVAIPHGPGTMLLVLAYFVGVHLVEAQVVGPRITGQAVGIHPATGIIALLAGTELFGVWGALFGAPLAGLLQAIVVGVWRERKRELAARLAAPGENVGQMQGRTPQP